MVGQPPLLARDQIEDVDVGVAGLGQAHRQAAPVRGEMRREGHSLEIAELGVGAGGQIEHLDLRLAAPVGHERDILPGGVEARGQDQVGAVGQELVIGAVLIHDREPLHPVGRRAAFGDIDDPGVEIAGLAGDPLIDRIGDLVRHPPPVVGARGEAQAA